MWKPFAIGFAIMLGIAGWQTHRAKSAERKAVAAEVRAGQLQATLDTERNDRRLANATIDRLNKDLDDLRNHPPIVGVRCRTTRAVPAEGGSAVAANAAAAGLVEGMPAEPLGGDAAFGPEVDVSAAVDWYAARCSEQAVGQASLQWWESARGH